jgi:hypothetical protein
MEKNDERWSTATVRGSTVVVESGFAVNLQTAGTAPEYWFSGHTTTILGAAGDRPEGIDEETVASWRLTLDAGSVQHFSRGFLVIACLRRFGGLHTDVKNSRADVWLNQSRIDGFALRIIPSEHSDYFHRPPVPDNPHVSSFLDCQTIYAWPIQKPALNADGLQQIKVRIDKRVRWDVDYVGLAYLMEPKRHRVFLSHCGSDKPIARQLAAKLQDRGIGVWLDEAELGLGDSLIEKIRGAIDAVDYVAVLLSEESLKSEWVKREVDVAMNQEIAHHRVKVLPIRLDSSELPGFLLGKLYAQLQAPGDLDRVVAMIEAKIRT